MLVGGGVQQSLSVSLFQVTPMGIVYIVSDHFVINFANSWSGTMDILDEGKVWVC